MHFLLPLASRHDIRPPQSSEPLGSPQGSWDEGVNLANASATSTECCNIHFATDPRSLSWNIHLNPYRTMLCLYVAILLTFSGTVSIRAQASCSYSTRSVGILGNIPYPAGGPYEGITFRVWAPSATAVKVTGEFNSWGTTALCKETLDGVWNDYWSIDLPGATTGLQYRYSITAHGHTTTFRDPLARVVNKAARTGGNSITYDPTKFAWKYKSPTSPHWLKTLVIYEMHIGTFNATANSLGTFEAAISKLSWIQHEGFNAIELIPIGQFDGAKSSPYSETDPYAVDNDEYGGPDRLKALIDAAHSKGLAVLLDVVFSLWNMSPDSSIYDWENSKSPTYPGGEYFYDYSRYIGGWGSRPNYSLAYIGGPTGYIAGEMSMWVNEYHVDGFRWDSIGNIYNTCSGGVRPCHDKQGEPLPAGVNLIQNINRTNSSLFNIAEDLTGSQQQPYATLAISPGLPNLGFSSQWNATLAHFFEKDMPGTGSFPIADLEQILSPSHFWNGVGLHDTNYLESHNELLKPHSRLIELIDNNLARAPPSLTALKKYTLAASILFTTPSVPMVYQGDEFLDYSTFDRKTPLDWTNATKWPGIATLYRHLIAARVDHSSRTPGLSDPDINVFHADSKKDVVAWDRYNSSSPCADDVVVIANLSKAATASSYTIGLPCSGRWHVVFNSDSQTYNPGFAAVGPEEGSTITAQGKPHDGFHYSASFSTGKFSVIILSTR
jgi:1,4-alpha-glucan branching enzyme